jgi:hypothetical protein
VEQQQQTKESVEKAGWELGRKKKKTRCEIRKGRRRRVEELVLSSILAAAKIRRSEMCTYTATPSKRMMMMGERGSFWVLLFSGIEPVSARKWRLVLFFCPALSGSQVLRVAVRSEGWLDVLLACSGLAWEVVPLIEVTCATGRGPPISRLHILLPSTPIYSNLVSSHLPTVPDPRWNFASTSGWRHIIRSPCRQQCLLAPEDPMNPRN